MATKYNELAFLYGLRKDPTIVTDSSLNVMFFNHTAALLGVVSLEKDFIRKALTSASMQRVQRCRRTKSTTVFTQYVGTNYRQKFRIKAEWEQKDHLVFTLYEPHGYTACAPLYDTMVYGNVDQRLRDMIQFISAQGSALTSEELADTMDKMTRSALRCHRQARFWDETPQCYAFHMATLMQKLLEPCDKYFAQNENYQLHYRAPAGSRLVKCDGNLLGYVLYSLISTQMQYLGGKVTLEYSETDAFCRVNVYSGEERPLVISDFGEDGGHCVLDSFGLASDYQLAEKMGATLEACYLMDEGALFRLTFPVCHADGGFKETVSEYLTKIDNYCNVEFSIL